MLGYVDVGREDGGLGCHCLFFLSIIYVFEVVVGGGLLWWWWWFIDWDGVMVVRAAGSLGGV